MDTIFVYVDGGCKGNGTANAASYGSFAVEHQGEIKKVEHFDLPECATNNEAEYESLSRALVYLVQLSIRAPQVKGIPVVVKTDSQLVYGQLAQGWKVKAANLVEPCQRTGNQIITLRRRYASVELEKVDRSECVRVLGH